MKRCSGLDNTLTSKIARRLIEYPSISTWTDLFNEILSNTWLHEQGWFSLDWLTKNASNLRKVLEGQYRQTETKSGPANKLKQSDTARRLEDARKGGLRI
jgi:hypothetical protein